MALNIITKQGSNDLHFNIHSYFTNDTLQWSNLEGVPNLRSGYKGDRINQIMDYGGDIGGPIMKDKFWFWTSYGVQDIRMWTMADYPDNTKLKNFNLKFTGQVTKNDRFTLLYNNNEKTKQGRGASPTHPPVTCFDQGGPGNMYKLDWQHIFNENFMISGKYAFLDFKFHLLPGAWRITGGPDQPTYDYATADWGRSYYYYYTWRPEYQGNIDGNYYKENVLAGDHELKFGFEYRKTPVRTVSGWDTNAVAAYYKGYPVEVWLNRETRFDVTLWRYSFYVGDTYTIKKLTLNLGLRYDYQTGKNNPVDIPPCPLAPDLLPGINFAGNDPGIRW